MFPDKKLKEKVSAKVQNILRKSQQYTSKSRGRADKDIQSKARDDKKKNNFHDKKSKGFINAGAGKRKGFKK